MRLAILPITLLAFTSATIAHATMPERVTARVSLEGIDLASGQHQAELERRVLIAARRACDDRMWGAPRITASERACMAEMLADARVQSTRLAARAQRSGLAGRR
jgi:UrcA family protein